MKLSIYVNAVGRLGDSRYLLFSKLNKTRLKLEKLGINTKINISLINPTNVVNSSLPTRSDKVSIHRLDLGKRSTEYPTNRYCRYLPPLMDTSKPDYQFLMDDDMDIVPEKLASSLKMAIDRMQSNDSVSYIKFSTSNSGIIELMDYSGMIWTSAGILLRTEGKYFDFIPEELIDEDYLLDDMVIVLNRSLLLNKFDYLQLMSSGTIHFNGNSLNRLGKTRFISPKVFEWITSNLSKRFNQPIPSHGLDHDGWIYNYVNKILQYERIDF